MNRNNQRRALLKGKALPLLKEKFVKNVLVFRKSRIISKTFIIFAGESLFNEKVCYNKQSAFMDLSNISVYR